MRRAGARLTLESCETFVALLCVLSSAAYLSGTPAPKSIDALLPVWLRVAWGGYLFAGGLLILVGLSVGRRRTEKAGLLLLAGSASVYALALGLVAGLAALFPAGITLAFAAAFGVRASDRVQSAALKVLRNGQPD
jgi:hypothetical protein